MDPRFDTSKDPRFRQVPRSVRRVKVDKRFAHMFDDKRFVETPKVDPRGQRLRRDSAKNKLREFYELAEGADSVAKRAADAKLDATPTDPPKVLRRRKRRVTAKVASHDEEDDEEAGAEPEEVDDGDCEEEEIMQNADESSDDSDDDSSSGEDDDEKAEGDGLVWESLENDVPRGDATPQLAIMGCEWDHVSAADLLVLLRTYLNSKDVLKAGAAVRGGSVNKVAVYPSDYGLEQLAKEAQSGPQGLSDATGSSAGDDEDEKQATEIMRRYQLQRTKYYYAVADCDSAATASALYDQLDGIDASGISPGNLDLRFVPVDTVFPHKPIAEATQTPKQYQGPALERASALGHTKVHCSWDEAPAHRKRDLMRKRYTPQELEQMDLDAYLASTSEEDGDASGAENLKSLVSGLCDNDISDDEERDIDDLKKPEEGDMEMTFNLSAEKMEEELAEKATQQQPGQGRLGRVHTLDTEKPKTTWEQYLEKRKLKNREKRAKAKAEKAARKKGINGTDDGAPDAADEERPAATEADLELLAMDDENDAERGFNVRGKLRTAKQRAAKDSGGGNFKVDVNDPRIAKVFGNADFDIDPTNPEFRPSEGMQAVLKKKRERKIKKPSTTLQASSIQAGEKAQASTGSRDNRLAAGEGSTASGGSGLGGIQLFASKKRKVEGAVELGGEGNRASNMQGAAKSEGAIRIASSPQDAPISSDRPKRRKKRR